LRERDAYIWFSTNATRATGNETVTEMSTYEIRGECGTSEQFEAVSDGEARDWALSWMSDAEFDLSTGPVHYHGWLCKTVANKDGDEYWENLEHLTYTFEVEEPDCIGKREHDWKSPLSIVGGVKENPGVYGHGGGVVITEICAHCGAYRETDTWAQDSQTGEQGLHETTYRPADDESLTWVYSRRDRYTLILATSPGGATLLIGSPRDGDEQGIEDSIASHRMMEKEYLSERDEDDPLRYRPSEIELTRGCVLTDEMPEVGEIVWSGSEGGWLMDEHGETYKYAVKL